MKFNDLIFLIESKYSDVAKHVIAKSDPFNYTPGDEMVRLTFDYTDYPNEVDIEDLTSNDIVAAPHNLKYAGVPYFFKRGSDVFYCKEPLVIEVQKLFNEGEIVGEGRITEKMWEEYYEIINAFYRGYFSEKEDINESRFIKVAERELDRSPPKEPVTYVLQKMENDGLWPEYAKKLHGVIPFTGRRVFDGLYIDTAPAAREELKDTPGTDEKGFYTLYITNPEYMAVFMNHWENSAPMTPAFQELQSRIYTELEMYDNDEPVLP